MFTLAQHPTDGLRRVLATYEAALADHRAGRVNYPCGYAPRQVKVYVRKIRAELDARA
jgi:hypothetical protein